MATVRPTATRTRSSKTTPTAKAGAQRLKASAQKVKAGAPRLTASAHKAAAGTQQLTSNGAHKATASARRFTASARKATAGAPQLKVTARQPNARVLKPKSHPACGDSWLYELRSGLQVVFYGVSATRERESIQQKNSSKGFTQLNLISVALTRASALKRELQQVKKYQQYHGGRPPKYNIRQTA